MTYVLIFAAALWGVGWLMGVRQRSRWMAIGALYLGVLMIHMLLPWGHPLREATGVRAAVAESHPEAFQCAERLRYLLTVGDETLSDDEITYLALLISRLMQSAREGA